MPYGDPDPADPNILIGVEAAAGPESDIEMAYVFAEEFARLGFSERRLLSLFHTPFYAGAYRAMRTLGEERVRVIIRETLQVWSRFQHHVQDAPQTLGEDNHESDL